MNNTIKNYSKKSLKKNRPKMWLIVLAVALSAFLINISGILAASANEANIKDVKIRYGSQDGMLFNLGDEKFDVLKNHTMIKNVGKLYAFRDRKYKADNRLNVDLYYIPSEYNEYFNVNVGKGSMCEKNNEIVISNEMSIELSKTVDDYLTLEGQEYRISGVIDKCSTVELNGISILVSEQYFDSIDTNGKTDIAYVNLKNEKDIRSDMKLIGQDLDVNEKNICANINLANALNTGMEYLFPILVVSLVILFTAVISIYNIFNISVKERINEFGLLLSLGATKSNIKGILKNEGVMVCVRGIPIGLIASIIVGFFVIPNIATVKGMEMKIEPICILLSIAVSVLTVFISTVLSGRTACRISPLAAVNYTEGKTYIGRKSRKSEEAVSVSRMARINLFRNKKRTSVTILSISMFLILFITISTIISSMDSEKLVDYTVSGDYEIGINMSNHIEDTLLDDGDADYIKSINGVKDVNTIKVEYATVGNAENSMIAGYSSNLIQKIIKKADDGDVNIDKMNNENGILIIRDDRKKEYMPKIGDKVRISNKDVEKEFIVQGIIDSSWWKVGYYMAGFHCIISDESFKNNFGECKNTKVIIDADKNDSNEIKKYIEKYMNMDSLKVITREKELEKAKKEMYSVEFIGYSAVVIIGIIGFINFINTTITNIIGRKRELAVLEAVGLTRRNVKSLLNKECLYTIGISSILGLSIGMPLSYMLFLQFKSKARYAQYHMPLVPIIIIILSMIILQWICVKITHSKISKGSVVDNIRFN